MKSVHFRFATNLPAGLGRPASGVTGGAGSVVGAAAALSTGAGEAGGGTGAGSDDGAAAASLTGAGEAGGGTGAGGDDGAAAASLTGAGEAGGGTGAGGDDGAAAASSTGAGEAGGGTGAASRLYRVTDGTIEPVAFRLTGSVYEGGVNTGAVAGTAYVRDPEVK